jgi:hypothetical protein
VESALLYVRSNGRHVPNPFYTKLVEEIKKDLDHVSEQAGEVPWELLKFIETLDTVNVVGPSGAPRGKGRKFVADLFA